MNKWIIDPPRKVEPEPIRVSDGDWAGQVRCDRSSSISYSNGDDYSRNNKYWFFPTVDDLTDFIDRLTELRAIANNQ